jgi:hypothetical protein
MSLSFITHGLTVILAAYGAKKGYEAYKGKKLDEIIFNAIKNVYHGMKDHPEDKIPKSWLTDRVSKNSVGFENIRAKMQSDDELWNFRHFAPLAGRGGIAIVRNGVIIEADCFWMS